MPPDLFSLPEMVQDYRKNRRSGCGPLQSHRLVASALQDYAVEFATEGLPIAGVLKAQESWDAITPQEAEELAVQWGAL
jgi:hypothetical protein